MTHFPYRVPHSAGETHCPLSHLGNGSPQPSTSSASPTIKEEGQETDAPPGSEGASSAYIVGETGRQVGFSFCFPLTSLTHSRGATDLQIFPLLLQPCPHPHFGTSHGLSLDCFLSLSLSLSWALLTPSHLRARG